MASILIRHLCHLFIRSISRRSRPVAYPKFTRMGKGYVNIGGYNSPGGFFSLYGVDVPIAAPHLSISIPFLTKYSAFFFQPLHTNNRRCQYRLPFYVDKHGSSLLLLLEYPGSLHALYSSRLFHHAKGQEDNYLALQEVLGTTNCFEKSRSSLFTELCASGSELD
jgi:hypothetical protein